MRLYEQMPKPNYVIVVEVCTITEDQFFNFGYNLFLYKTFEKQLNI